MASFSFDVQIANTITDAKVEYRLVKVVSGGTQSTSYVDNVSGDGNFNIIFNNVAQAPTA